VERLNLEAVDITDEGIQCLAEMLLDNVTISYIVRTLIHTGFYFNYNSTWKFNTDCSALNCYNRGMCCYRS